jgi:hypothetical protein
VARETNRIDILDVPDELVVGRVRTVIERAVSHPAAIAARVRDGRVTLSGPVLTHEAHDLLRRTVRVAGVRRLHDELKRHATARGVPALQTPGRQRPGPDRETWRPVWRLLRGGAGLALGGMGARRGGPFGIAMAAAGGAMLLRALRDKDAHEPAQLSAPGLPASAKKR